MEAYRLIVYFFIYGFAGWCVEVAFASVKERRFVKQRIFERTNLSGVWSRGGSCRHPAGTMERSPCLTLCGFGYFSHVY